MASDKGSIGRRAYTNIRMSMVFVKDATVGQISLRMDRDNCAVELMGTPPDCGPYIYIYARTAC